MINKLKSRIFLLILIMVLFSTIPLNAQLKRDGLIFSEVYLNDIEPDKSWLEVYNPTTQPLVLERVRFYDIMTTNILPQEIQKNGGIELLPGECVVVCANEFKFVFKLKPNSRLIQVSAMKHFGKGGFFYL